MVLRVGAEGLFVGEEGTGQVEDHFAGSRSELFYGFQEFLDVRDFVGVEHIAGAVSEPVVTDAEGETDEFVICFGEGGFVQFQGGNGRLGKPQFFGKFRLIKGEMLPQSKKPFAYCDVIHIFSIEIFLKKSMFRLKFS